MVFLPQETIIRKRDGEALARGEIGQFIAGLTDGSVSHAQAAAFAMAVFFRNMTLDERVALTEAMRDSGTVLDWSDLDGPVVDKHSTGGVGDNVSLMLAPILAACGVYVPMISGRGLGHTGGTLDKFDSIPGYTTQPDNALFRKVTREAGCAIIGQTADLAPADKILYSIRDVTGTVENVSLITASILSKKLAAGLGALILDVKTGSGAFMPTLDRSRELAESLVAVANGAGTKTAALITDMNEPLASAAGNALEIRNAVEFLTGKHRDHRLLEVTLALSAAALELTGFSGNARHAAHAALSTGKATEHFSQDGGDARRTRRLRREDGQPSRTGADRPRRVRAARGDGQRRSIRAASAWPWWRWVADGACRPTRSITRSASTGSRGSARRSTARRRWRGSMRATRRARPTPSSG